MFFMSIDALHTEYNPRTDDNFEGITSVDENVSVDNSVCLGRVSHSYY